MRWARCVNQSNDLIAYEDLRIKNTVKKYSLAGSTSRSCLSTAGHVGTWLSDELNGSGDMVSFSVGSGLLGKATSLKEESPSFNHGECQR